MSEGRRTAKLKTQRDCSLCDLHRELVRGVLICAKCDAPRDFFGKIRL